MFGSGPLLKLYGRLDPETSKLFKRFVAKCLSMENPNEYLKEVLKKELDDNGEEKTLSEV